jgi:hypothetical protein
LAFRENRITTTSIKGLNTLFAKPDKADVPKKLNSLINQLNR